MRVLLVEPDYRRSTQNFIKKARQKGYKRKDDEGLWYPPIGLMKLSTFHKNRGDEVQFSIGKDASKIPVEDLFSTEELWDRVYITTLFTFNWSKVVETINFYKKAVGGSVGKIFVGGIMASLMPKEIYEETNVYPVVGLLNSPEKIRLDGDENIDELPPDYSLLDSNLYAINDTYYGYTTRGCSNKCKWCGVPIIEGDLVEHISITEYINSLRTKYGDKPKLKLMDNNVMASPCLEKIVDELFNLGYGKGQTTESQPPRTRLIDFNQGLDATYFTEKNIALISRLNIRPMRIAFDRISEKESYVNAIRIARKYGFTDFSNYILYNWKDTPKDLYERLQVNIDLNKEFGNQGGGIYSYPMRFAPIRDLNETGANKHRDFFEDDVPECNDYWTEARWTRRFVRNVEIIKGATHGAISPTWSLAQRAIGDSYERFIANLYMPEELLRYRNKYEATIHEGEPPREPGDGTIEKFVEFISGLLSVQDGRFLEFHNAVSPNTTKTIKDYLSTTKDEEVKHWLQWYLKK